MPATHRRQTIADDLAQAGPARPRRNRGGTFEMRGVDRVSRDVASKPPETIE
jgi:hypothetical protein